MEQRTGQLLSSVPAHEPSGSAGWRVKLAGWRGQARPGPTMQAMQAQGTWEGR